MANNNLTFRVQTSTIQTIHLHKNNFCLCFIFYNDGLQPFMLGLSPYSQHCEFLELCFQQYSQQICYCTHSKKENHKVSFLLYFSL